jgi:hypothetical protein
MLLWSIIFVFETLVGLASAVVFLGDSGFYTLTQAEIDSTNLYAYYASAVKCDPQYLTNWTCGGAYLFYAPLFFSAEGKDEVRCTMSQF